MNRIKQLLKEKGLTLQNRFAKPVWYCYTTNAPMGAKRVRESRGLTIKQVSEAPLTLVKVKPLWQRLGFNSEAEMIKQEEKYRDDKKNGRNADR